jgi:hypothetical protein
MCLIEQPFKQLEHLFDRITYIHSIWPDCPLDYYQNNLDVLMGTDLEIIGPQVPGQLSGLVHTCQLHHSLQCLASGM